MRRTRLTRRAIQKLLIANRGEIACRIIRTCNAHRISTVAVYSDAEPFAKHAMEASEAVRLGPPEAASSYLCIDRLLAIATATGVDAIHPGYGFLSENAAFAQRVENAGIIFVGPPRQAMVAMGSKKESKEIMKQAGVPILGGYHGEDQQEVFLAQKASEMGYPVLIKAVMGGGGKGMKLVFSENEFLTQLHSAKREAQNFFADDRVLLERFIERPRHIEIQVFFDQYGKGVYFFERDCSVQRRYQKVLEEAPAPLLDEATRAALGETAIRAGSAVGYVGAGTVEFIYDTDDNRFYFMEMNTRLQVEHPVTEEIVRISVPSAASTTSSTEELRRVDLVKLQLDVAAGEPLFFEQKDIKRVGAALEARIFAEDPDGGFLPQSGRLDVYCEPFGGQKPQQSSSDASHETTVRVDSGYREGDDVSIYYDPMISKLIVWGRNRDAALNGMSDALERYAIAGIRTNIAFLKRCVENEAFRRGGVTTKFISDHEDTLMRRGHEMDPEVAAMGCAVRYEQKFRSTNDDDVTFAASESHFRSFPNLLPASFTASFRIGEAADAPSVLCQLRRRATPEKTFPRSPHLLYECVVDVASEGGGDATRQRNFRYVVERVRSPAGRYAFVLSRMLLDEDVASRRFVETEASHTSTVAEERLHLWFPPSLNRPILRTLRTERPQWDLKKSLLDSGTRAFSKARGAASGAELRSPMPCRVTKLVVAEAGAIEAGAVAVVVEAMKMEHLVRSPMHGVVRWKVDVGALVGADDVLGWVDAAEAS